MQRTLAHKAASPSAGRQQLDFAFPGPNLVQEAVARLAEAGAEERGAIFTRREVVDFILDLVGYTVDRPLQHDRLLEPSFGDGDFLFPALERLFAAFEASGDRSNPVLALKDAVRGVELHRDTHERTATKLQALLIDKGLSLQEARALGHVWLHQDDFLLAEWDGTAFTHVIGNPPYVRQEMVPDVLMNEYRRRFTTIYDRADLYVPFIEQGLGLLAPEGRLGFICADRWMKNRYGGPLRKLVAEGYRLKTYVDMVDTPAFHSEVSAYPAIFVIANEEPGPTRIAHRPAIDAVGLSALAASLTGEASSTTVDVARVTVGSEPWILESLDELAVVRRLEASFPTLEEAGCKVGIGVATGADQIFVGKYDSLDVEPERKLPLAMGRDINSGTVNWRGHGVINPFLPDGKLASFKEFPRFGRYLETHGEEIKKRHVSQKNPGNCYRTIDRIYPELTFQPKLLIPDIKGSANIVYEAGKLYPHHNLYFITSSTWDLHALQAVLLSGIARLFVATYSTKMRGGFLRFQAQYIRRIRLPDWKDVTPALRQQLAAAAASGNQAHCNDAVAKLYQLSAAERKIIMSSGS